MATKQEGTEHERILEEFGLTRDKLYKKYQQELEGALSTLQLEDLLKILENPNLRWLSGNVSTLDLYETHLNVGYGTLRVKITPPNADKVGYVPNTITVDLDHVADRTYEDSRVSDLYERVGRNST